MIKTLGERVTELEHVIHGWQDADGKPVEGVLLSVAKMHKLLKIVIFSGAVPLAIVLAKALGIPTEKALSALWSVTSFL